MNEIEAKYKSLLDLGSQINSITDKISSSRIKVFSEITIEVKFKEPELCFNTLISWLYIFFFEASGRNLDFIKKKFAPYNIALSENATQVQKLIHAFRTVLQHNLDLENSQTDIDKKNLCEFWFHKIIGKNKPENDENWKQAIDCLLDGCIEFMASILKCLKDIATSEHIELVQDEWEKLANRDYSVYEFESILVIALRNLGLSNYFDTNQLTKKNIDNWRKDLDVLPDDFHFETVAYKIIERFLLKKDIIPITGKDIIELGVTPGTKIFNLLIKAKELFYENPCTKEELLIRIQKYL